MIYVCIPVYNEERTIGVLLWKIRRVMRQFGRDYVVWVYDDASTDETATVLRRYENVLPLKVIRGEERLGYARALEWLIREAAEDAVYPKRDVVVTLQGDFTEGPEHIVTLAKSIEGGADLVAGRASNVGAVPRPVRFSKWAAPILLRGTLRNAPVPDPLCGLRAYRVIVLRKALRDRSGPLVSAEGWAANLEMLRALAPHARRLAHVPVELRYDLRQRPSRVRPLSTLRSIAGVRRGGWDHKEVERTHERAG